MTSYLQQLPPFFGTEVYAASGKVFRRIWLDTSISHLFCVYLPWHLTFGAKDGLHYSRCPDVMKGDNWCSVAIRNVTSRHRYKRTRRFSVMSYARTGSTVGMHEDKYLAEFSQLWALVTINLFICAWLLKIYWFLNVY